MKSLNRRGMTLIEVLVSLLILSFLSVFTFQTMRNSVKFKQKTQQNIDQAGALSAALRVMERDINLSFHYRDLNAELEKQIQTESSQSANPSAPPQAGTIPPPTTTGPDEATKEIKTHFLGESDSLHFTSIANVRALQDSPEADQMEVGYFLKSCTGSKPRPGKCLWRRVSYVLDEDVTKGGEETPLLEGVTEFQLQYFGAGREEWLKTWKTDDTGDELSKDIYPLAVEITLTTEWDKKPYTRTTVAALRFPNNKEKKSDSGANPLGTTPQGSSSKPGGG